MLLTADEINAESFEKWNAKQHGDPEEIGFLQALRIAYCHGQDSMKKAVERAVIEKLCAGVDMPEPVHNIMSDGVSIGYYSLDQLRAYGAACRMKALDDAEKRCEAIKGFTFGDVVADAIRNLRGEA